MKIKVFILLLFFNFTCFAQCVIEVIPSSCNGNTGLIQITSGEIYDAYQWYSKPINSSSPFQPILNATSPSFSFNWATFDQSIVKVFCFLSIGTNYFSNEVVLDLANCNLGSSSFITNTPKVKLYPNPAKDYVELENLENGNQIEIFNSVGQKVLDLSYPTNGKINISNLFPGVYFLKTKTNNTFSNFKFIKI